MKLSVTEIQDMIGKQAGPTTYSIRMYSESGPSILYLNNEQFQDYVVKLSKFNGGNGYLVDLVKHQ